MITKTDRHPFNGIFSRIWVTNLDFTGAGDDGVAVASAGPYANYLHLAQTDNHASTSPLNFL